MHWKDKIAKRMMTDQIVTEVYLLQGCNKLSSEKNKASQENTKPMEDKQRTGPLRTNECKIIYRDDKRAI